MLWVLQCGAGLPEHLGTLPLSFASSEAWPDLRVNDSELLLVDVAFRRAMTVLRLNGSQLTVSDVLPFDGGKSLDFRAAAFIDAEAWGIEGGRAPYRLVRMVPA